MEGDDITLLWHAHEHEHFERGNDWYWALGVVAVCGALVSVLFGNVLFGVLIIVAAFSLGLTAHIPPGLSEIELSDKGIRIDHIVHTYEDIIAFWVEEERDGEPILLVDTKRWLSPNLIIPITHMEPRLVRAYLAERAREVKMHEPMAYKVLAFFGF